MNPGAPNAEKQQPDMSTMQSEIERKNENLRSLVVDMRPVLEAKGYFDTNHSEYQRIKGKLDTMAKKNVTTRRSLITGIIGAIMTFFLIPLLPIERTLGQLTDYQMRFCGAVVAIIATGIGGLAFYGLGRFYLYVKRKSLKESMKNSEEKAKHWYEEYLERQELFAAQHPGILD